MTTSEKILNASIALFSQKGYDSVTTKEIAKEAGVSEMTVFRHFDNKRNLFEKAFEQFMFSPTFKNLFEEHLVWDLEKDLMRISHYYQEALIKNHKIILMEFKNNELTCDFKAPFLRFPTELKRLLAEYFSVMNERGVIKENPEVLAFNFLAANFGFFMTFLVNRDIASNTDSKACISSFVRTLIRGMTA